MTFIPTIVGIIGMVLTAVFIFVTYRQLRGLQEGVPLTEIFDKERLRDIQEPQVRDALIKIQRRNLLYSVLVMVACLGFVVASAMGSVLNTGFAASLLVIMFAHSRGTPSDDG